jgi:hypothetical protein
MIPCESRTANFACALLILPMTWSALVLCESSVNKFLQISIHKSLSDAMPKGQWAVTLACTSNVFKQTTVYASSVSGSPPCPHVSALRLEALVVAHFRPSRFSRMRDNLPLTGRYPYTAEGVSQPFDTILRNMSLPRAQIYASNDWLSKIQEKQNLMLGIIKIRAFCLQPDCAT